MRYDFRYHLLWDDTRRLKPEDTGKRSVVRVRRTRVHPSSRTKQHGYHLEHNFGHGKDTLASVLVVLNLIAFALHTACELAETLWQRARQRLGTRTVTEYQVFPDWNALIGLLATGGPAAQPS